MRQNKEIQIYQIQFFLGGGTPRPLLYYCTIYKGGQQEITKFVFDTYFGWTCILFKGGGVIKLTLALVCVVHTFQLVYLLRHYDLQLRGSQAPLR